MTKLGHRCEHCSARLCEVCGAVVVVQKEEAHTGRFCLSCSRRQGQLGKPAKNQIWTADRIVEAIRERVKLTGELPMAHEYDRDRNLPNWEAMKREFGGAPAAIRAAGFVPRPPGNRPGKKKGNTGRNRQMVTGGRRDDAIPGAVKHYAAGDRSGIGR